MKLSRFEIADIIDRFLSEADKPWDWDDFISIRLPEPDLEKVRVFCAQLPDRFPAAKPGQYCSEEGLSELRRLMSDLRDPDKAIRV